MKKVYFTEKQLQILATCDAIEIPGENSIVFTVRKNGETHSVIAKIGEEIIGLIGTSEDKRHDALQVMPQYRKMGVGETLWHLKTSLDGFRPYEWSAKYSRIRFLIRHGYYPIGTTESADTPHRHLTLSQRKKLLHELRTPHKDDACDQLYALKRAPIRALWLAQYL